MDLKDRIRQSLISNYGFVLSKESLDGEELKKTVTQILEEIVNRPRNNLGEEDKKRIISELVDEFTGLGPIEKLMKDPSVTEIMINGPKKIYVERQGRKELTNIYFDNASQLMAIIYKILAPTRRHVDEYYPYTDISLKDGSRVNIIIPPLALDGPTVTIRKFLKEIKTADDLVGLGTLDKRMSEFLVASVKAKANIIFSGATGSGKTTTMGMLSGYIDKEERIVTIEDTAELHLNQEHVVRLETRPQNIEGRGEVTIRDLFRNSLRMRPGRIIIGEIRGAEALDMLQAMCSGHSGSLAVIHASSPREVIYRMETLILTSGLPVSLDVIHRQIAAAVHLIVQEELLTDGSRKITHITQVNGLRDGQVVLEDVFIYEIESVDSEGKIKGRWRSTGVVPAFYHLFKKRGIELSREIFNKD